MTRGLFITVEGCEGVGKSSNVAALCAELDARGVDYLTTREPGGTPLAESIRELLLSNREETVDSVAELLLVFAARAQHLAQVVRPALARGVTVVCDRFTDATVAYQGAGRELGDETIEQLRGLVHPDLEPDITVLLDLDVDIALQRAKSRGELDRFESEGREFFERVRASYLQQAAAHRSRYLVIDASVPLAEVQSAVRRGLAARLEQRHER